MLVRQTSHGVCSWPPVLPDYINGKHASERWNKDQQVGLVVGATYPKEIEAVRHMADRGVLGGVSLGRLYPDEAALACGLLVTVTECTTDEDIEALAAALEGVLA